MWPFCSMSRTVAWPQRRSAGPWLPSASPKAPTNPRAYVSLGLAEMQQGTSRYDDAVAMFRQAIAMDSTSIVAWRSLGLLESLRGNWRAAAEGYSRVLRVKPDNLDANDGMARALLREGRPDAAMPHVDKVGPADIELLWTLGDQLVERHGRPKQITVDNGPEFTGQALDAWAYRHGVQLDFIDPGKPMQNGHQESFNGKFRDECLNMEWFRNRTEARVLIEIWRRHYNDVRPHSSLQYRTPSEFHRHHESEKQSSVIPS